MRFRWYIPFGKHLIGINFRMSLKKREGSEVVAIANKMGHRYCVFLDYDYNEQETVYEDITGLQEHYQLGNAYVFTTKKGFHAIFIDLLSYEELKTVMDASSCDEHYKYVSRRNNNRTWVLRISDKKGGNKVEFKEVLEAPQYRQISYPHKKYLQAQGVPMEYFEGMENFLEGKDRKILFVKYKA
jgi:hypothetical protein